MKLKIIKTDNILQLHHSELLEEYKFDESINFSKIMGFLLSQNLSETISLENKIKNMSENENELVSIVESLIKDYNNKVEEFKVFSKQQKD